MKIIMLKCGEVIGLPVVCADNGKKIGTVKDIMYNTETREIKALVLGRRGMDREPKAVMFGDILSLGTGAVVVSNRKCAGGIKKASAEGDGFMTRDMRRLRIYSKAGEDIGFAEDILFDDKTGMIEGIEVSDGLFRDIIGGRRILPLIGRVEFGEDNILVEREAVEEMASTGGGVKKRFLGG